MNVQLKRRKKLYEVYWKEMIEGGSSVLEHEKRPSSARHIIIHLRDKPRIVLKNQQETVFEHKEWDETDAGKAANKQTGPDPEDEYGTSYSIKYKEKVKADKKQSKAAQGKCPRYHRFGNPALLSMRDDLTGW